MASAQGSWFIPAMVAIVVVGIIYFFWSASRQRNSNDETEVNEARSWHVQCPRCNRWKRVKPIQTTYAEAEQINPMVVIHPGAQYHYTNVYKCVFCGHTWQESYLE